MYYPHPSSQLTQSFRRKPYQGVEPTEAKFLFVGLDANFSPDIETSLIYPELLSYQEDGAKFWRRTGVHHPFLLSDYRGDGRKYHSNFARIGFKPEHANLVSFIELLPLPTVGRSGLQSSDLDAGHLSRVNEGILHGRAEHIFVSAGVRRLMASSGAFEWLPVGKLTGKVLPRIYEQDQKAVYLHLHFSNYGKFEKQMLAEASAIHALLPDGMP